jgi:glycerophosphoryl diester phosphodiesterase
MSSIVAAPAGGTDRPSCRRVRTVAHRGASAHAPENTIAAVRAAIAGGTELVELDVQRCRDGALVLLHDVTLTRTTNVRQVFPDRAPWLVGDFTLAEIQRLDAGSWKSPHHAGERVPTLQEAVEVLGSSDAGLLLELKAVAATPGLVPDVLVALREPGPLRVADRSSRLVVQSFDHRAMQALKELDPSVSVGLLGSPTRAHLPTIASWADQVNPGYWTVDAAYVAAVHDAGMECMVWTVNRLPAMRAALRMGVDGVITDRPDVLRRLLESDVPPYVPGSHSARRTTFLNALGKPSSRRSVAARSWSRRCATTMAACSSRWPS